MWFIDTVEFLLMHRAGQASSYALSDSMHEEIVTLVWHCVTIAVIMSHIVLYYIFIFYECCVKVLLCYTDIIDHEISQKKDSVS